MINKKNKAVLITIGDELLIGQTIDTNSAWIAQALNKIGIAVIQRIAVGDESQAIQEALDAAIAKAQFVFITGGLGPTADDITKPLLCNYFQGSLIRNTAVEEHVTAIFTKRNRPILERNLKQADVPDNCNVLFNQLGTAPGMWFEKDHSIIIALPGVPFEMMGIVTNEVIPKLTKLVTDNFIIHETLITAGHGESFLAEKLIAFEENLPNDIKLAYLPSPGIVKLRLTGQSTNQAALQQKILALKETLMALLKDSIVATEDVSLDKIVSTSLKTNKLTIGLAESCTGGYIAHLLTQHVGASQLLKGSLVCYQNEIKERILEISADDINTYGVYSETIATKMAYAAKELLGASIGIGISGKLSEDPIQADVPTGTIFISVVTNQHQMHQKLLSLYDRERNKEVAAQAALLLVWKLIQKELA
jgi:nicotinamide-nucleotide amidase